VIFTLIAAYIISHFSKYSFLWSSIALFTINPDTIVFLFQQNYYIATRENIRRMTSLTNEGANDNSIVYECIRVDTLSPENILRENPGIRVVCKP
jgi:hypothetical protein